MALCACAVESEVRETVAIDGSQLPSAQIPPGQIIRVETLDGALFSAAFVALTTTDLVTRQRTTFSTEEQKTQLKNVMAVSYEHVVGTRVQTVGLPNLPLPGNLPFNSIPTR